MAQFTDGTIPFTTKDQTFHTYYKIYGDLAKRPKDVVPLVVLHGGPGFTHDYCPMKDLATMRSPPVIFYDQIGNGNSTHVGQRDFWTIDLFIAELENLLFHFDIQEKYDIAGHSWGGMLGVDFAIRRQHPGLRHLILADSLAAMELWNKSNMRLLEKFPQEVKDALAAGFEADKEKYRWAMDKFNAVHGCTVQPIPKVLETSFAAVYGPNGDRSVGLGMCV